VPQVEPEVEQEIEPEVDDENLETTFGDSANGSVTYDDSFNSHTDDGAKSPAGSIHSEPSIQDLDSGVVSGEVAGVVETKEPNAETTSNNDQSASKQSP